MFTKSRCAPITDGITCRRTTHRSLSTILPTPQSFRHFPEKVIRSSLYYYQTRSHHRYLPYVTSISVLLYDYLSYTVSLFSPRFPHRFWCRSWWPSVNDQSTLPVQTVLKWYMVPETSYKKMDPICRTSSTDSVPETNEGKTSTLLTPNLSTLVGGLSTWVTQVYDEDDIGLWFPKWRCEMVSREQKGS